MVMRQGCLRGLHQSRCIHELVIVRPSKCRARSVPTTAPARQYTVRPVAAAAADAPPAAEPKKRGRKPSRPKTDEEEKGEEDMPMELPTPLDFQQTLIKSFTLGGIGLHSGEYAVVRVRPAHAGEGRYFVRVPTGTNSGSFLFDDGNDKLDQVPVEEAYEEIVTPDEVEDARVEWFRRYLAAQEEDGFIGTFAEFLDSYVVAKQLDGNFRNQLLGIVQEYPEPEVEPDFSLEPEDIVALDEADPTLVRANIENVVEQGMPFTQLGQGDNRVMSVELLLAALEASGVDNCRIEVEGGNEIPVLDNSALGWCIDIQCAGLRPAPVQTAGGGDEEEQGEAIMQRDLVLHNQGVAVQDADGWIAFFPGPFSRLTAGIDHSHIAPVIGTQWYTWHSDDTHFRYALAPARAYVECVEELFHLREEGYLKAGAENLFLVANGDRWWDASMVRMVYDEPVRFKLSQLVGNLSLLSVRGSQGIPVGHITAFNASPALQVSFAHAMYEALQKESFTGFQQVLEMQDAYLEQRYEKYGGVDDDDEDEEAEYTTSVGGLDEEDEDEAVDDEELAENDEAEEGGEEENEEPEE